MKLLPLFVQDDYKLRPNLTVNLGLRYQMQTGWSEVKGNASSFDPTVPNPATGTLGAMWYGTTRANGRTRIQNGVYNTFLPRIGFSYQLDPNTVIRGGFGLYAYNWSNDTYNGASQGQVMGGEFGSKGNATDTTNGAAQLVSLSEPAQTSHTSQLRPIRPDITIRTSTLPHFISQLVVLINGTSRVSAS